MAKALLGHVGIASDPRLLAELRRLQVRVRDLEDELARVRAANEVLSASVAVVDRAYGDKDYDKDYSKDYDRVLREPALA